MTPSFTVAVGGDPAAIRSAADWLRNKAEATAKEADMVSGDDAVNTSTYWEGESAAAFTDISYDLVEAAREITAIAGPFAEKMHIFAGKIERMREHFEGFLKHAEDIGLRVQGTEVYRSVWPGEVPPVTSDPLWDEWRAHQHRERDYGRIQRDVVDWHAGLEVWIGQNLVALASEMPTEASKAEEIRKKLREAAGLAGAGAGAGAADLDNSWVSSIARLNFEAQQHRANAAEMVRKCGVTGDPALRARLTKQIAQGLPDIKNQQASNHESFADFISGARRVVQVAGVAGDVAFATYDLAHGTNPLEVAIDWAGSSVGASAGGQAAQGLPFWLRLGVMTGGSILGGVAATAVWESTPPSWREGIYEFIEDGLIVAGDMGESIGDWFYDVGYTLSHRG